MKQQKVSLLRRGIAFMIDCYLGALLASLPVSMLSLSYTDTMTQNVFLLPKGVAILSVMMSLTILGIYYIVLPLYLYQGQTLGKRLMNIRILYQNRRAFLLRQLLVILLFSSGGRSCGYFFTLLTDISIMTMLQDVILYVSLITILSLFTSKDHIALHERITNTVLMQTDHLQYQPNHKGEMYESIHG